MRAVTLASLSFGLSNKPAYWPSAPLIFENNMKFFGGQVVVICIEQFVIKNWLSSQDKLKTSQKLVLRILG